MRRQDVRKITIFISLLLILSVLGLAQAYKGQGRMNGRIIDEEGNPVEGVKVKLFSVRSQSGFETETDAKGEWRALYIRGGTWNIDLEKDGYAPKKISVEIKEYSRNQPMEFQMTKIEGFVISDALMEDVNRGNQLFDEGKYEEAVRIFGDLVAKDENAFILNKNIGNCYFELLDYEKAEAYYRKVLDKEPDNAEIMMLIGNTYSNRGEAEKALEWYGKIEIEKISDPTAIFNIANSLFSQSNLEEALKYCRRGLELEPDSVDILHLTGLVNLSLQRNDDAIAAFEKYLKLDSESARADQVRNFLEFLKKKIGG